MLLDKPFPHQLLQSLHPHPMDPSGYPISGQSSRQPSTPGRREVQLQGPRPSPLRVSKDSHMIKKPPLPADKPPLHPQPLQPQVLRPTTASSSAETRQPVIIYAVSPTVIHADPSNFMAIVQRLTGLASSAPPAATSSSYSAPDEFAAGVGGPISPAARLASIEKTSPVNRGRERNINNSSNSSSITDVNGEVVGLDLEGVDLGQIPGILSPSPTNLPWIPSGLFSPALDIHAAHFDFPDSFSPLVFGHAFQPSPSGLLSPSSFSPKFDLSSLFD